MSQEIINKLTEIFQEVLDDESIQLTPETTAEDVEEWDSLNHIHLIVAIEKSFGVKFNSKEIQSWKNIGEMVASIASK